MPSRLLHHILNPNIDLLLNPFIPRNPVKRLPEPISHFLGHRSEPSKEPNVLTQWTLTVFATVAGLCVVGAVYNYAPGVKDLNPPVIVASLGASAVLDYNAIRSPLSQPRNSIAGHTIAAIVGVAVAKGFQLSPHFFANFAWVAAALACAGASLAMSVTNTVHPPGGATAIIATTDALVIRMGWWFPAMMLLASTLMVAVACLFNNIARQYPMFWWTPEDVGYGYHRKRVVVEEEGPDDEEKMKKVESVSSSNDDSTLAQQLGGDVSFDEQFELQIQPYKMRLPQHLELSDEEVELLKGLQARLRTRAEIN